MTVQELFLKGYQVVVENDCGYDPYTCDDIDEINDAMYEDEWCSYTVDIDHTEQVVTIYTTNDE